MALELRFLALGCGFLWLAVQGCRWNAANRTAHCPWFCAVMVSVRMPGLGAYHHNDPYYPVWISPHSSEHRLAHTKSRPPHLYTHTMIEICLTIPYRWRLSALPHPSHRLTLILSRFVPFCSLAIPTLAFALCLPSVGVWTGLSVGGPFQTVSCLQASRRPVRFPRRHPHCIVLPP